MLSDINCFLNLYFDGINLLQERQKIIDIINKLTLPDKLQVVMLKLLSISYGETYSYKAFAAYIDRFNQQRAVATLLGKNPMPIIVPCHRIIKSDGAVGGYIFGTSIKNELINFEKGEKALSESTKEVIRQFYRSNLSA